MILIRAQSILIPAIFLVGGIIIGFHLKEQSPMGTPLHPEARIVNTFNDLKNSQKISVPVRNKITPEEPMNCLAKVPLRSLKQAYDTRLSDLEKNVVSTQFPVPESDNEKKLQAETAFSEVSGGYKQNSAWKAGTELRLAEGQVRVNLLFIAHTLVPAEGAGPDQSLSLFRPDGDPSQAVPMVFSSISANICWNFGASAPDLESGHRDLGQQSGCLDHLSHKGNQLFIKGSFTEESVERSYTHFAINIPQQGNRNATLSLLSAATEKWEDGPSLRWGPVTANEAQKLMDQVFQAREL